MFSDSICDSKSLWGKDVTQDDNYGSMGCEVFERGIQNYLVYIKKLAEFRGLGFLRKPRP